MSSAQRAAASVAHYWLRGAAQARRKGLRVDAAWMLAHAGAWRAAAITGVWPTFPA